MKKIILMLCLCGWLLPAGIVLVAAQANLQGLSYLLEEWVLCAPRKI